MRGHGSQWISNKINIRHPLQLKKSKSWEPFGSYQLNSTANPAHSPQNWAYFEVNGLNWQCCLAGSSKMAPRIFIFSIVLGAEYLSYVKSTVTHARVFNISAVSSVYRAAKFCRILQNTSLDKYLQCIYFKNHHVVVFCGQDCPQFRKQNESSPFLWPLLYNFGI